jgi:secretion/DNA translocation related CpaE-like protein
MPQPPVPSARPLFLTGDPLLLDDLLRLAAAGGAEPDVADHAAAAAPLWRDAPFVVVGADRVADAAAYRLPRRPSTVVIGVDVEDGALWRHALELGAEQVLFLPDAESFLVDRLSAAASGVTLGRIVAVVGARGGAGATSFAVAYALAAARAGHRTMLVDADPYGGGVDLALGAAQGAGPGWQDFVDGAQPVPGDALATVLPRFAEVTVLAWSERPPGGSVPGPIPVPVLESVLAGGRRGADVVVVDLPRSFDEASRLALALADVVYLVCPAEFRACASGQRVAVAAATYAADVRLVVRGPAPGAITAADVTNALGLPLAGHLDPEPGIERALERGDPPGRGGRGPLASLCDVLVAELTAPGVGERVE